MTPERILFRVDTGPKAGLGHLQRCLAVAHALAERSIGSRFAVPDSTGLAARVAPFELVELPATASSADIADIAGGAAVVIDSYGIDSSDLLQLSKRVTALVVIDDWAAFPVAGRLCVNGGAHAPSLDYRSAEGGTRFLLGTDFTMLGCALWDAVPRRTGSSVKRILLTLGGSDPHGLATRLLAALDPVTRDIEVTVAVGPYFEGRTQLESSAATCRHHVELLDAPASLVPAMREADLAVSAAGQSLYELLRLGVPTIALTIAANQTSGLAALAALGAVACAGGAEDPTVVQRVGENLRLLVDDQGLRRRLSDTGAALVDGQGARRVAAAIAALDGIDGVR